MVPRRWTDGQYGSRTVAQSSWDVRSSKSDDDKVRVLRHQRVNYWRIRQSASQGVGGDSVKLVGQSEEMRYEEVKVNDPAIFEVSLLDHVASMHTSGQLDDSAMKEKGVIGDPIALDSWPFRALG